MGRGSGGGGRGRGRHRREYSPRATEDRAPHHPRSDVPASRRLWVGNLSPHVTQSVLSEQFLRFGDLESISYIPGRTYAFVNFRKEEDAVMALRALQGAVVAGSPLKIEFQKADKPFSPDSGYTHPRDERYSIERGDSIPRKESGLQHTIYEQHEGDKNAEPSEVLWIWFPASLHIDEMVLGRAFAPFGEIDKITTFPGRSYAFVRYRSVVAACRAKEALQGKLFNNPRVSICFARSDLSPDHVRYSANSSSRSNLKPNLPPLLGGRFGENSHHDRNFESSMEEPHMPSPRFFSDMENLPRDTGLTGTGRSRLVSMDASSRSNRGGTFESSRFQGLVPERRVPDNPYDQFRRGPSADRGAIHDLPVEPSQRGLHFEDLWTSEDADFPLAKKVRLDTFPDRELPEYPFSDFPKGIERPGLTMYSDLPEFHLNKSHFDPEPLGHKGYPDKQKNKFHTYESDDFWRPSDALVADPGSLQTAFNKLQGPGLESRQPLKEEWKWEGTLAKGGTPVCRARCFPVGKVLDMMLPEFLDCTARTGLDMLAKHFYQAASSWVVFFVPGTDADITFYNEFMNYLGEKQRAAVAKLGEKTTLFLVPPSEFSEHVLKVPGKMSISGVILRFQQNTSNIGAPPCPAVLAQSNGPSYPNQTPNRMDFHKDALQSKRISPDLRSQEENYYMPSSGNMVSPTGFPTLKKADGNILFSSHDSPTGQMPGSAREGKYDQQKHQNLNFPSNWPPQDVRVSGTHIGAVSSATTNASSRPADNYPPAKPHLEQGVGPSHSMTVKPDTIPGAGIIPSPLEFRTQITQSAPIPTLQPEQLAQLAALLEQQKRLGKEPALFSDGDHQQSISLGVAGVHAQFSLPDSSVPQFNKPQQLQQLPSAPITNQAVNLESYDNQQVQTNLKEETETDPQKRLQATLQLAAALLQQIQQQSRNDQQ